MAPGWQRGVMTKSFTSGTWPVTLWRARATGAAPSAILRWPRPGDSLPLPTAAAVSVLAPCRPPGRAATSATTPGQQVGLRAVRFLNRGQALLTASEDGSIQSSDLGAVAGRQSFALAQLIIDFSADQRLALLASADGKTTLWDLARGKLKCSLTGHAGDVKSGDFSASGGLVATAGADKYVLGIRCPDRQVAGPSPRQFHGTVSGCVFSRWSRDSECGRELFFGSSGCPHGQSPDGARGAYKTMHSCALLPGWAHAARRCPGTIRLWDWRESRCRSIIAHGGDWVMALAFSADGSMLATGGLLPVVKTWEVHSGKQLEAFSGHSAESWGFFFPGRQNTGVDQ